MTAAVLTLRWFEVVQDASEHAVSADARRSSRELRSSEGLAPSISVDEAYQQSIEALIVTYRQAAQPDWDGYGARAVTGATLAQAMTFLSLLPSTVPPPDISPHPDGELEFEWHQGPRRLLTVSVDQSGKLSYAALTGQTRQHGTEFLLDALPEAITLALRKVHSGA